MKREFRLVRKLGSGAFSSVYHVIRRADNCEYALKKVNFEALSTEKDRENAINEVRILSSLHHPHVIAFHEAFVDHTHKSLW